MTKPDDPFHPEDGGDGNTGMTIREYMATHILAGFGLHRSDDADSNPVLARTAVARADLLIEELNKPRKGKT